MELDTWPLYFSGQCTNECKVKMKKIYKIVFDDFIEKINNFFDDAKIIPGADKIDFHCYLCYFEHPTLSNPIFTSKVEERFFVYYFIEKINNFFDDTKIIPGAAKIDFNSYLCYFENPTLSDPIFTSKVEERFFVANVNGIPTR
ncbi:hypothetical protein ACTFIW_002225 [Dictyostelium discoideum]